jgi:acyl-CoA synthetase (AMP-forming)/AMP-acid ligase II
MGHSHLLVFAAAYLAVLVLPGPGVTALVARVLARGTPGSPAFIAGFVAGALMWFFAVKAPDATVCEADVIEHCRRELAAYKVPKQVCFIEALPKSAVGKILRRDLRALQ